MTRQRMWGILYAAAVVVASLTVTIWYAVARGQDFNWDQRNYHIGIPFLLEHGTFWTSIAPAGVQSYFNPYVYQAEYLGMRHLSPIGFAVTLAALQSVAFMLAGLVCLRLGRLATGGSDRETIPLGLLGFALCLMAPIVLSEAGTTFIEFVTAVPVLAAYVLLLFRGGRMGSMLSAALAGLLLGIATALKLTNGVFALGVVGFTLAGREKLSQRIGWLILCGTAALLAFVAVGGLWHLGLWERFSNPFFPYLNNIFHSPDAGRTAGQDQRFVAQSVIDVWRYPLYWLLGGSPRPDIGSPSSEVAFRDARWVVAVFGATLFLAGLVLFPRWRARQLSQQETGLLLAFAISYLLWLQEFGIHRYTAPIDVLCGAMVLFLVAQIRIPAMRLGLMSAFAAASLVLLSVPSWGRLPWGSYWQTINPIALDFGGPAIVFLTVTPTLHIAPSLPTNARYVGVASNFDLRASNDSSLTRQLRRELGASPSLLLKVVDQGTVPAKAAAILSSYGLVVTARCQELRVAVESFRICDVERKGEGLN